MEKNLDKIVETLEEHKHGVDDTIATAVDIQRAINLDPYNSVPPMQRAPNGFKPMSELFQNGYHHILEIISDSYDFLRSHGPGIPSKWDGSNPNGNGKRKYR